MDTDPDHGPEYVPLPSAAAREGGQADPLSDSRQPRVPNADPSPLTLLALSTGAVAATVVALGLAGGAIWHFASGRSAEPSEPAVAAERAEPAVEPPSSPRPLIGSDAAERNLSSPRPLIGSDSEDNLSSPRPRIDSGDGPAAPTALPAPRARPSAAAPAALPEPPTAATPSYVPNAAQAIAAQTAALSPAEIAALFNGSSRGIAVPNAGGPAAGSCPSCDNAINVAGTAVLPNGPRRVIAGRVDYIGPCQDGYVYRVTNLSQIVLPNALVADDGQVWRTGRIAPGQSVEIRSKTLIRRTTSVNLP